MLQQEIGRDEKRLGIALSGGGHRASLFGLGVLMYLADAGKLKKIASISSVSGGSITNGYVAQLDGLDEMNGDNFKAACYPLARALARTGTLWAWWGTWAYVVVTIMMTVIALVVPWLISDAWLDFAGHQWESVIRYIIALTSLGAVWQLLISRRGLICQWALEATLLNKHARPTRLEEVARDDMQHIFCATEIHVGEHIYFSGRFVYSFRLGCGVPAKLTLAQAVQASAAFPGGFMPTTIDATDLRFKGGKESCRWLSLLDGGLYDNMAEQWQFGMASRIAREVLLRSLVSDCNELIVVNASSNMTWTGVGWTWVPFIGELASLLRTMSILFDNTTTVRRLYLVDKFSSGRGMEGALVTLEQTPLRVPRYFAELKPTADSQQASQVERGKAAVTALRDDVQGREMPEWNQLLETNKRCPTTLRALGVQRAANLIQHGYATAMANLHVVLDYPMVRIPDRAAIKEYFATGRPF